MQIYSWSRPAATLASLARVDKQVRISAGIYTGFHKRQGVLWHAGVVMIVVNNQQVTFQLTGKILQVTFFVAFGLLFWCIHIAFAVHHFIITGRLPDTPATPAEYLRVTEHQGSSHADLQNSIRVRRCARCLRRRREFREFNAFHLIFAFFDTEMAEGGIFKC